MDTKRRTILVVDDDSNIRRLVEVLLEDAGYSVLVAADGIEGINVFKRHQPEIALLITDVMMPNMNGFDLADSVLELDSDLPVIFMSGNICCACGPRPRVPRETISDLCCGQQRATGASYGRRTKRSPRRRCWSVIHPDPRGRHGKPDRPGSILCKSLGLRRHEKS
jgi:CheY-like chemotaxis protein